jgi:hypothetical protein
VPLPQADRRFQTLEIAPDRADTGGLFEMPKKDTLSGV